MEAKKTGVKDAKKITAAKKAKASEPKQYAGFKGLLNAKTSGTLPRGTKATVCDGAGIDFRDGKGNQIAWIGGSEFITGELKRHGFKVTD